MSTSTISATTSAAATTSPAAQIGGSRRIAIDLFPAGVIKPIAEAIGRVHSVVQRKELTDLLEKISSAYETTIDKQLSSLQGLINKDLIQSFVSNKTIASLTASGEKKFHFAVVRKILGIEHPFWCAARRDSLTEQNEKVLDAACSEIVELLGKETEALQKMNSSGPKEAMQLLLFSFSADKTNMAQDVLEKTLKEFLPPTIDVSVSESETEEQSSAKFQAFLNSCIATLKKLASACETDDRGDIEMMLKGSVPPEYPIPRTLLHFIQAGNELVAAVQSSNVIFSSLALPSLSGLGEDLGGLASTFLSGLSSASPSSQSSASVETAASSSAPTTTSAAPASTNPFVFSGLSASPFLSSLEAMMSSLPSAATSSATSGTTASSAWIPNPNVWRTDPRAALNAFNTFDSNANPFSEFFEPGGLFGSSRRAMATDSAATSAQTSSSSATTSSSVGSDNPLMDIYTQLFGTNPPPRFGTASATTTAASSSATASATTSGTNSATS